MWAKTVDWILAFAGGALIGHVGARAYEGWKGFLVTTVGCLIWAMVCWSWRTGNKDARKTR